MMLACFIGNAATAQTIESLIMPGEVVQGHAEFESECTSCHRRFNRSDQRSLCLDCHEDVANDVDNGSGFHGKSGEASTDECATCHTDHEGRNANILGLDEAAFDHDFTDFQLLGKHVDAECVDCHAPDDKHRDTAGDCIGCHIEDDVHKESLGTECADCHTESDWLEVTFDHDTTDYPLVGKHSDADCLGCHDAQIFVDPPQNCFACHADDDAHDGRSGEQCETCHNPTDWNDSSFDHARDTEFTLLGRHARLSCDDCHSADPFSDQMDMECVSCHLEDDDHDGHHGTDCGSCHTNDEWPAVHFDHDRDTDFVLNGSHETVECVDCHIEPIFETSPGTECASCHLEDEVHNGKQGDQCGDCHTETSWEEAPLFTHDLTAFPLLGEHDNLECESCHETKVFAETDAECISCHLEDDSHNGRFEEDCQSCHNPVAWDLWLFDHNTQTNFKIEGAHVDVACDDCHRGSLASMQRSGDTCGGCHRADDVHDGDFGPNCGRCHSDQSFLEVRSLH